VQDLQYGSTGKGQIAGSISHATYIDTVVTAWGPNAGHTFRKDGKKFVSTMLAVSAIAPSVRNILIGPGSVLDVEALAAEVEDRQEYLRGKWLVIHPQATLLRKEHAETERNSLLRVGSTMKGTGAAACDKLMRVEGATVKHHTYIHSRLRLACPDLTVSISSANYDMLVDMSKVMMVEGAQGFSLGIHTNFYPHTTSRDVSTAQLLADCRLPIPEQSRMMNIGTVRTFPIRVANRVGPNGEQYTSGSIYPDQVEIKWSDIDREPELTTVTKLPRRIFTFSMEQVRQAVRIMQPTDLALTFCDYLSEDAQEQLIADLERETTRPVTFLSHGPDTSDVTYREESGNELVNPSDWMLL
jgi:adenylosuccinate synthase